nr:MAG TPA: hypothetical protein [Caudoviricetes sp.]
MRGWLYHSPKNKNGIIIIIIINIYLYIYTLIFSFTFMVLLFAPLYFVSFLSHRLYITFGII